MEGGGGDFLMRAAHTDRTGHRPLLSIIKAQSIDCGHLQARSSIGIRVEKSITAQRGS